MAAPSTLPLLTKSLLCPLNRSRFLKVPLTPEELARPLVASGAPSPHQPRLLCQPLLWHPACDRLPTTPICFYQGSHLSHLTVRELISSTDSTPPALPWASVEQSDT